MRTHVRAFLLALACFSAAPALAGPDYTTTFSIGGQVSQSTPQYRSASGALPWSWGSGTFAGSAYAGPGRASVTTRTDCTWEGGFSGSFGSWTRSHTSTDDLIITGPAGTVHGTVHVHVSGAFDSEGGFPTGGGAGLFWFYAGAYGRAATGQVNWSTSGASGINALSGVTSRSFDLDIPIEADYPTNTPLFFEISSEVQAGQYGNATYNPGMARADGGPGGGVSLGASGVVMELPAGYSLSSVAWNIHDNQLLAVPEGPRAAALRLQLASLNPTSGDSRLRLTLPRASHVRAVVYDASGRAVRTLLDEWQVEGPHDLLWDGRDDGGASVAAGLYFARISAGDETAALRVARLR